MPGLLEATVNVDGTRIRVFNVHLDYRSDPTVRKKQVEEIVKILSPDRILTILTGDLNTGPESPELWPLWGHLHNGRLDPADSGFTYPSTKPEKIIDYVLASDRFCPTSGRVPKAHASDHFPVVADIVFNGPCRMLHAAQ